MPKLSQVTPRGPLDVVKSWLLGFLAGDGAIDYRPGTICRVTAHIGGRELLDEVVSAFERCYEGANPRSRCDEPGGKGSLRQQDYNYVRCDQKMLVEDLLSFAPFGLRRWHVPVAVQQGSEEIRGAWLRGFFDADGDAIYDPEQHVRCVEAHSVNRTALRQVVKLLQGVGVQNTWHARPPREGCPSIVYTVRVSYHEDLERFAKVVSFASESKRRVLEQALASLERRPVRKSFVEAQTARILRLRREGKTFDAIGRVVDLQKSSVQAVCKRHGVEPEVGAKGSGRTNRRSGERAALFPRIMNFRAEGLSGAEIAKRVGLAHRREVDDVVKYYRRKGMDPKPSTR